MIILTSLADVNSCQENPCGGTCVDTLDGYYCICPEGYTGDLCEYWIDFCLEHYCQNDASCVSTANNFTCLCPDHFTGPICEIPIGECLSPSFQNLLTLEIAVRFKVVIFHDFGEAFAKRQCRANIQWYV